MFTKEYLKEQLKVMGIKPYDTVLIHTSYKAVGEVEGGPDAFLDAFCEYLDEGLFLVPTTLWCEGIMYVVTEIAEDAFSAAENIESVFVPVLEKSR